MSQTKQIAVQFLNFCSATTIVTVARVVNSHYYRAHVQKKTNQVNRFVLLLSAYRKITNSQRHVHFIDIFVFHFILFYFSFPYLSIYLLCHWIRWHVIVHFLVLKFMPFDESLKNWLFTNHWHQRWHLLNCL